MQKIKCKYHGQRYCKDPYDDESWGIWTMLNAATRQRIVALGVLPKSARSPGNEITLYGEWVNNEQYGKQFKFNMFSICRPRGRVATVVFLQQAPGIGPAYAERLWDNYGEDALDILAHEPERAVKELGLANRGDFGKASSVVRGILQTADAKAPLIELFSGLPFPKNIIETVLQKLGAFPGQKIRENPFILTRFARVGFALCDQLRIKLGLSEDMPERLDCAALHSITSQHQQVWVYKPHAYSVMRDMTGVSRKKAEGVFRGLYLGGDIAYHENYFATRPHYRNEQELCRAVTLARCVGSLWPAIRSTRLTPHQIEQIEIAQQNGAIMVLMGSAGTGKTFCVSEVIRSFHENTQIQACAPTGKAAQRMYQAISACGITHITPKTIHKLLGAVPNSDGQWTFRVDGVDEFIETDLLIVDEASMADNELMLRLISGVRPGTKVIIIGDPYQLPPVGRGTFLRDWQIWCDSGQDSSARYGLLSEIKRNQGEIIRACSHIRVGQTPSLDVCDEIFPEEITNDNLRVVRAKDEEGIQRMAVHAANTLRSCNLRLKSTGEIADPVWDFQVIVATNKETPASKDELNPLLQDALNPCGAQVTAKFRIGDKVICKENSRYPGCRSGREMFAANGAFGSIKEQNERYVAILLEDYPQESIKVPKADLYSTFDLGYAVTCHRMQGSQAPIVFVCLSPTYKAKLVADRSWLYTAITRAQELAIVSGEIDTIREMCSRTTIMERVSFIPQWLTENGDNGQAKDCTIHGSVRQEGEAAVVV